jgi:plasmid stability protein
MSINVSLKNVPDEIMEKLRQRAKAHHRSVQGELMAILEEVTNSTKLSLDQAESRLKELRLETGDDSTTWIRELRNAR